MNSKHENPQGPYVNKLRPDWACFQCGCNIESKTHDLPQVCPLGKWGAETDREEADKIEQIIKTN